jgi:hypothetical protein
MKATSLAMMIMLSFLVSQPAQSAWVQTNGPSGGDIESLAAMGSHIFAGSAGHGVYVTMDDGNSWNNYSNVLGNKSVMALAVEGGSVFAGSQYDGVYLSTDSGVSWTQVNNGITNYAIKALAVRDTFIFAGTLHAGVFRSSTRHIKWDAVNVGLSNLNVQALAVCQGDLFAGTSGGGVFWSRDNGESWSPANEGLTDNNIYSLAAAGYLVYAGSFSSGVFRAGGGNTLVVWVTPTSGMSDVSSINALVATDADAFAGMQQDGVSLSTNSGRDWNTANTASLTNRHILALTLTKTELFAGTSGSGVFRRLLSDMGIAPTGVQDPATKEGSVPQKVFLDQNYSNPFNPTTRIAYSLSAATHVSLGIYDGSGRLVRVLVDATMPAGRHEALWDGKDRVGRSSASGVYFYRLNAGSFTQTRKMILLR